MLSAPPAAGSEGSSRDESAGFVAISASDNDEAIDVGASALFTWTVAGRFTSKAVSGQLVRT
jgi:hypothetical protein